MTENRHYTWLINPITGDYVVTNGDPVRDETLQFPAYVRLKLQRNSWMYAPDTNYGSTFNNVRKRTSNSRTLLRQVAEKALQPLIDDRRAVTIDVENTDNARHAEALDVTITEREGSVTSFSFNPLGS